MAGCQMGMNFGVGWKDFVKPSLGALGTKRCDAGCPLKRLLERHLLLVKVNGPTAAVVKATIPVY